MLYSEAGVDIDAANKFVEKIKTLCSATIDFTKANPVVAGIGGFCSLYEVPGNPNQLLAATTDGVGSKLNLALKYREMGALRPIGQDLVAMSVNDLITCGATPLFFLDYLSVPRVNEPYLLDIIESIAKGCYYSRCVLIGGETAEHPDMYGLNEMDMAGFALGIVNRDKLYGPARVEEGDILIGIQSSGPHANGFTLIHKSPLIHDNPLDALIKWCLVPTMLYEAPIRLICDKHGDSIKAMAHITGGGLEANIKRVIPEGLSIEVDWKSWSRPNAFDLIQDSLNIEEEEMRRVFNLGIGFVVIVKESGCYDIMDCMKTGLGFQCYKIGLVKKVTKKRNFLQGVREWLAT